LNYLRERLATEFGQSEQRIRRLEENNLQNQKTIKNYRITSIILFILFFILLFLFCVSCFFVYRTHIYNMSLLEEKVVVEVKKELFNRNLELIITFLEGHRII
jgi:hypothetical protein